MSGAELDQLVEVIDSDTVHVGGLIETTPRNRPRFEVMGSSRVLVLLDQDGGNFKAPAAAAMIKLDGVQDVVVVSVARLLAAPLDVIAEAAVLRHKRAQALKELESGGPPPDKVRAGLDELHQLAATMDEETQLSPAAILAITSPILDPEGLG